MPEPYGDDLFRQIAESYVNTWGESLQQELEELNRESPFSLTRSLDRKVLGEMKARKRRRFLRGAGVVAACLLLAVLLPRMMPGITADSSREQAAPFAAPSMEMAGSAPQATRQEAENEAFALPEAPAAAAPNAPLQDMPSTTAQAPREQEEGAPPRQALGEAADQASLAALPPTILQGEGPAPAQSFADQGLAPPAIPLPISLPEGFSIRSVRQDGEKDIYDLQGPSAQPIVLTLEYASPLADTRGLAPVRIGSRIAFGSAYAGQYRLIFEQDGILCGATSPNSMEILMDLMQQLG